MSSHDFLSALNEEQRAAVTAPVGPVLVLAGAGSGKTRVLTHRAAWLILEHGVSPHGLMAVTFTNKAAAEMRGRIESLLGMPADALWIGTFHGLSHRMLRRHWREARLPQSFQILDQDDQERLVRKVIRDQKLDEQRWVPREVQGFINASKDEVPRYRVNQLDTKTASCVIRGRLTSNSWKICSNSGTILIMMNVSTATIITSTNTK